MREGVRFTGNRLLRLIAFVFLTLGILQAGDFVLHDGLANAISRGWPTLLHEHR